VRARFGGAFKPRPAPADTGSVRQRRQPEAETFYERPLPNTIRPNF